MGTPSESESVWVLSVKIRVEEPTEYSWFRPDTQVRGRVRLRSEKGYWPWEWHGDRLRVEDGLFNDGLGTE